ncbi:hypothetical protein A1OO_14930 [Enterovibrio norvegicus FF-33]|nr:hypothetical protein A1OO_14930 [Enterovibrio norvegicus FF-33]
MEKSAPSNFLQQARKYCTTPIPLCGKSEKTDTRRYTFRLMDYLELVDWTGRQCREDKRGHIESREPDILSRLGFGVAEWLDTYTKVEKGTIIGTESSIKGALPLLGWKRLCGYRIPAS